MVFGYTYCDSTCQGESDRVLGFFFVGSVAPEAASKYQARRGALDDKVTWMA